MSNGSLSAQELKTLNGLYSLSPEFRSQVDQIMADGVNKAKKLVADLSKLSLNGTTATEEAPAPAPAPKKRGRPKGSVNKGPAKPRVKKDKPAVVENSTQTVEGITHGTAISEALNGVTDGLSASGILEAIVKAKHKGYNVPAKQTLYTTLNTMKNKGTLKMLGEKPNTRYILA